MSERKARVRLKLHTDYLSTFMLHSPTNEPKNKGEAKELYQSLQAVVRWSIPERDLRLFLGDINSWVGNDVETGHGTVEGLDPQNK